MQPAQANSGGGGTGSGNRQLKRWGPIIGIVLVVLIGGGIILATRGDDDDSVTEDTAAVPQTTSAPTTPATTPTTSAETVATEPPGSSAPGTAADTTVPAGTDSTAAPDTTAAPETTAAEPAEITYPMSFPEAVEAGVADEIEWGERCDTETGRLAVPDFFAPECYVPFEGDNGGATAPGVTGDEINVVYYEGQEGDPIIAYITDAIAVDDTNQQQFETMQNIIRYYETYYEMYGRTVNLITFEGTGGALDDVAARADAARIAEEFDPFVVLGGPALTSAFADELAARQIMCIGCTPGQPPQFYVDRDPYVWGLDASAQQKQRLALEMIEKQLINKPAEYAGENFQTTTRTFALVYIQSSQASQDLADSYAAGMEAMGVPFVDIIPYTLDPATLQATASQVISKLKADGVTTIIFSGDPVAPRDFTREATAQEYFPEWFLSASTLSDISAFARTYDQEQWQHAYGVTSLAARVNPGAQGYRFLYEWFNGVEAPSADTIGVAQPNPALFFATVQRVGPNLTHETWRDALFAFPGTQQAISQPYLTYGDKGYWPDQDYQGIDDMTILWWDPTATGPDEIQREGTGMYQFVDGGRRYLPGDFPTEEKLFDPEGAVTLYETPPPGEEPKQYPSPAG